MSQKFKFLKYLKILHLVAKTTIFLLVECISMPGRKEGGEERRKGGRKEGIEGGRKEKRKRKMEGRKEGKKRKEDLRKPRENGIVNPHSLCFDLTCFPDLVFLGIDY